jgi:GGDEF domain-containing protein
LLRDYRDKASHYLNSLREELSGTVKALQEIMDALAQNGSDHEARLRTALVSLRQIVAAPPGGDVQRIVSVAADTIEQSLDQIHKQHKLTVSQFLVEIRMLHKRIDSLERAATIDDLTKLWNRPEIEQRILSPPQGTFTLLLVRLSGARLAEAHFNRQVSEELVGAFAKRLRNSLPPNAVIGRWSEEEFAAILTVNQPEAMAAAKWISTHLAGVYTCLHNGKTVRPSLQLTVAVIDSAGNTPNRVLERVAEFFPAR